MSQSLLFIQAPGFTEWIVILVVVVLLFGGKKIPELMRGVGRGLREFNDAKNSVTREIEEGMKEKDSSKPASPASTTSNNEQH
ncbi:twin-arginine translocase TatA/TatE family subunit [Chitinophagaceae bacterium 26-R-25]|nr:twin-arginine translocase TatA/TatE family subunit [Chitinophagaceae bacterium 26-R-25]